MRSFKHAVIGLLLAALTAVPGPASAASTSELLQQGLYAEEVEGNINAAIKTYDQVIRSASASRSQVAQALYRQGLCYLKLKDETSARVVLEKLVAEHPGQTEIIEKARPLLEDLTNFDPAALMPPGTLMYLEAGSPGRQVETILMMLKGTPFENPLAAMDGGAKRGERERSSGDIVAALLNPSMLAEFQKIRSSAIGLTGIGHNRGQPIIAVLYPGKSDALRGLILAGLGMGGVPDEPIAGLQTVAIQNQVWVAYDDKVVIAAAPREQLTWCVKQYKGLIAEPTLASANPSFAKISKRQRQEHALTAWINVDETYVRLLKELPPKHLPEEIATANAMLDFANIDELLLSAFVQTNGLGWRTEVQFKNGHHCLVYDLVRTPNITRAALEAVPSEAFALASFSLSQADSARTEKVRAQVQNATGLDLGRELFANIEQVTLFLMPAEFGPASPEQTPGLADRIGLALTSRNPEQTRQILTTMLSTANNVSRQRATPPAGAFKVGENGKKDVFCYLDQANRTTILSLDRGINNASMAALKSHKSVCTGGSLSPAVNRVPPTASKLLLVNAGGALRLFLPQMEFGDLDEDQAKQLRIDIDKLARAGAGTTIEWRTDEQLNSIVENAAVTGVPPLNDVMGPIAHIVRLAQQTEAEWENDEASVSSILPAAGAPIIDGVLDDSWTTVPPAKLTKVTYDPPKGPGDLAAEYRALWDEKNLYLFVDVTDDQLRHDTPPDRWFESDGVEVYLSTPKSGSGEYGDTDYQYAFCWDRSLPRLIELKHNRTNGVQYAFGQKQNGYRVEIRFPWSTLGARPAAGLKIGLDVEVNDNDGSQSREGKIAWHDPKDGAWENPQLFGTAELAGLVGWWKFDEMQGTNVVDSSGARHDGRLVGNARWGQGKFGGGLELDGHGSFVRITDRAAFDLANSATVACWVNLRSVPAEWTAIVTKGDNAWRLSTCSNEPRFHFSVNRSPQEGRVDSTNAVLLNEWHHVAGVYQHGAVRLYLDGKLQGKRDWAGPATKNDFHVLIGENAQGQGRWFDGCIDDVRIYNYSLPEARIAALAAGK